jgi:hypothetical protein
MVDNFHIEISRIITKETKDFKLRLEGKLEKLELETKTINERISSITNVDNSTQIALENFSRLESSLQKICDENAFYEKILDINEKVESKHRDFLEQQQKVIQEIQYEINLLIEKLNKYIYNDQNIAPTLLLKEKTYEYKTEFDNGTGIEYTNLVILDLAILSLTNLPLVIHDSVLLKNIQYDAMNNIAQLYIDSKKQVFVAFDKLSSYPGEIQDIFNSRCVMKLSKGNGKELFGFSWSRKENRVE